MEALIDADLICYRVGFTTETEDLGIAIWRADEMLDNILVNTEATSYRLFLTGDNNFRFGVDPEYKAHRKDKPKPLHLKDLREHLINKWNANVIHNKEADDALGIEQCKAEPATTVICSIDKDLDMIPGMHYNFIKDLHYYVHEPAATRFFYKQLLMGDVADNIKGIHGIGPKKSAGLLDHLKTEAEMFETVQNLYQDDRKMLSNGKLLWIWRKENDDHWPTTFQVQTGRTSLEDLERAPPTDEIRA